MEGILTLVQSRFTCFLKVNDTFQSSLYIIQHVLSNFMNFMIIQEKTERILYAHYDV